MDDLPVDISYNKVIDWLTSRKKLVADWRKRLSVIQAQTSKLAKATPPTVLGDLPVERGGALDYFGCKTARIFLSPPAYESNFMWH